MQRETLDQLIERLQKAGYSAAYIRLRMMMHYTREWEENVGLVRMHEIAYGNPR